MSELGQFLKEKRNEKKMPIETLQEKTKIRKRYIQAIENGEYHILPGPFYTRAFIKSYAEAIGLKGDDIIEQFESELPAIPKNPADSPIPPRKTKNVRARSPKVGKWASRIVLYLFLLVIAFILYLAIVHYMGGDDGEAVDPGSGDGPIGHGEPGELDPSEEDQASEPDPDETGSPEEDDAQQSSENELKPEWVHVETSGQNLTYAFRHADQFELTIQANVGDVWVRLSDLDADTMIDQPTIEEGDERTWDLSDKRNIKIRFGHLRGKKILINGTAVDLSEVEDDLQSHNIIIQYEPLEESS
ncbi:helix-turn-helix domain-containing protein [Caldalkalibacillus salinus]|uniref:helix-turn-helix domain-containing protein n=1 Tax=Caldalkalibacillus salinus TaxID=2803787 RepID=UPI00192118EC|nr:helix-turn-helix domain-containing protein [Caldalkalibacillus salinus]